MERGSMALTPPRGWSTAVGDLSASVSHGPRPRVLLCSARAAGEGRASESHWPDSEPTRLHTSLKC